MKAGENTKAFGVSPSWLRNVKHRSRENGKTAPRPVGGKRFEKISRIELDRLAAAGFDATNYFAHCGCTLVWTGTALTFERANGTVQDDCFDGQRESRGNNGLSGGNQDNLHFGTAVSESAAKGIAGSLVSVIQGHEIDSDLSPGSTSGADHPEPGLFNGPRVHVALPIYNESNQAAGVLDRVATFAAARPNWEFVFVDDGSIDGTAGILRKRIAAIDIVEPELAKRLGVFGYSPKAGKGHAVKVAAMESDADYFLFTDGNLAYSLEHLTRLFEAMQSADVVIGSRTEQTDEFGVAAAHSMMGRVFLSLAGLVLGIRYRDTRAGLKGFRSRAARDIFSRTRISDLTFDLEALYLAKKLGHVIAEIPASVDPKLRRKSSAVDRVRDPLQMFLSLIRIRLSEFFGLYRLNERDIGEVMPAAEPAKRKTRIPGTLHRRGV